jgi:murein DD-endopeptidase MepM/ murein hydrolase activator NlpD
LSLHFDLPFHLPSGSDPQSFVNQRFGPTSVEVEPPGFVFPDTSVHYFNSGVDGQRHDHVHAGVDYGLSLGTPLFSPADGVVKFAAENDLLPDGGDSGFGNMILINHGEVITHYGHLSAFEVSAGQQVKQGQQIGKVGNTGPGSFGPHLHWSVIRPSDNHYVNPALFAITPVDFTVIAATDGQPVRIFSKPAVQSAVLQAAQAGSRLVCSAWTYAQPRLDNTTGHKDARWYRLAEGGWVASARVKGNAPNSQPLP